MAFAPTTSRNPVLSEFHKLFIKSPIRANLNKITIEEKICVVTTDLMQKLFERGGSDTVALYMFFYMTVKRQETNQIRATDKYCMNGLKWGKERVIKAKKVLIDNNLIEQIVRKDKQGKITGWYLKINYIWSSDKTKQVQKTQNQTVVSPDGGFQDTNALSNTKINALSNLNKPIASDARQGVENKKPPKPKREPQKIEWETYLKSMDDNKQEYIQLIGYYFRRRKLKFDTNFEVEEAIARHARAALKVSKFSKDKVFTAFDKAEQLGRKNNFDYTLDTVLKELTK